MYVGVVGVILSEALFFGSISLLIYAALLWFGFHLFIIFYEEPHLRRKFGTTYQKYCRKVPKWGIALQPFRSEGRIA